MPPVVDRIVVRNREYHRSPTNGLGLLGACIAAILVMGCSSSSASDGGGLNDVNGTGGATREPMSSGGAIGTGGTQLGIGGAMTGGVAQAGGSQATGGTRPGTGGINSSGGSTSTGHPATGGSNATGGMQSTGGIAATGGTAGSQPTGGKSSTGGAVATGGTTNAGGSKATGGKSAVGGAGGVTTAGGTKATGGGSGVGGAGGGATTGGASAAGSTSTGPCDIYAAANTPCVAAHSTVRALYGNYNGNLYQLRRASDKTTSDVPVLAPGGFANISVHNSFCSGTTCTISIIYDQTANKNDLPKSGVAHWLANGGNEANAASAQITVGGHIVHGIYGGSNVAYRNNATKGVAKGDVAEAMYMVVDGKRFNNQCCFDYGNAETSGNDDGDATMEAVYFGSVTTWGGTGSGSGPWVAADLENGVYKSNQGGWQTTASTPGAKSIIATFATAMLKGPTGNHFTLKGGDAQSGTLTTMWDGTRKAGYSPKKLQGAIILGTGGDGSPSATGNFFEGAMTIGNQPDSADDAVQANIVAAGYGR